MRSRKKKNRNKMNEERAIKKTISNQRKMKKLG